MPNITLKNHENHINQTNHSSDILPFQLKSVFLYLQKNKKELLC